MSVHSFFVIRSLLNLAKENKLTESFLWIPSLEGPTFDSPPTEMMSWIKEWTGRNYLIFLILWRTGNIRRKIAPHPT